MKKILALCACFVLAACTGKEMPDAPLQPVTVGVHDFCVHVDKKRDLSWSVRDTKPTITNMRRLAAKHDAVCAAKQSKPTS